MTIESSRGQFLIDGSLHNCIAYLGIGGSGDSEYS